MKWRVRPSVASGTISLPGDKSLAHRSLILAGMARGESVVSNLPVGADVRSTASCLSVLGVDISNGGTAARIRSNGAFREPRRDLDAGNSGTTMRLLCGVLAGQHFKSRLVGDASLSRRPMQRVVEPLQRMGARIASNAGTPPLDIVGGPLKAIVYEMPVASAQVKSAVILAAVYAHGTTEVIEKVQTRDHTERMLSALGVPIRRHGGAITVNGGIAPHPFDLTLPGDPSSASFFLAAGALTGGTIEVQNLLVNQTRLGFVRTLAAMGAQVETCVETESLGEPVGSVRIRGVVRNAVTIEATEVPSLIDELPLVALLATQIRGTTTVSGAAELRVKETDRIETVVDGLRRLGADIEPLPDGFRVSGPSQLRGAEVQSSGDHRVAMMLAVAGLVASGTTAVHGVEAADISFPGFASSLAQMGGAIETV